MNSGYYRLNEIPSKLVEEGYVAGDIVCFIRRDKGGFSLHGTYWVFQEEEIERCCEPITDGDVHWQTRLNGVMQEVATLNLQQEQTSLRLIGFNPHLEGGELSESTALVPQGSGTPNALKAAVAEVRNTAGKLKKRLQEKTKELSSLLQEQQALLESKAKELHQMVAKAEEAIWTINLYLGKSEEIVTLAKGQPALATEKIALRQGVLSMDEESALYTNGAGIDFNDIDVFDEWVAQPVNYRQVIPELKGVVALHIRSKSKDYKNTNPWQAGEMNAANLRWTYFLIRNGENLYRVYTDITLGSHLFPSTGEYDDLFVKREYNSKTEEYENQPLTPGDREYMEAMEKAEDTQRYYMRVVLVLQGLLDRTKIFHPLPFQRINICNYAEAIQYLKFIYDRENVIAPDRPSFYSWQQEINSKLEVGCRIIGNFTYGLHGNDRYDQGRLIPRRASLPESKVLYTIEKRDGDYYVFLYERTDTIRPRDYYDESHKAKVRASCKISPQDRFILNFDAATIGDMEYYLKSRLNRRDYESLIPVLQLALELKYREQQDEAPFRDLLLQQIHQRSGVAIDQIPIDELISWWKFKNRTHRALLADDRKAYTMILEEFRLRQERAQDTAKLQRFEDTAVQVILSQPTPPILVAHTKDNRYVAYVPANDQNIWVHEQIWSVNRGNGDVRRLDEKPWKLVDKRYLRWRLVYQHERWTTWTINPQPSTVLTDPEINQLINTWQAAAAASQVEQSGRMLPLFVSCTDEFELKVCYSDSPSNLPTERLLTNRTEGPGIVAQEIVWKRTKDGLVGGKFSRWPSRYNRLYETKERLVRSWDDNLKLVQKEEAAETAIDELRTALYHRYDYAITKLSQLVLANRVALARREFNAEFGDPELWEDHLKGLKLTCYEGEFIALREALLLCADNAESPIGLTVAQVLARATELTKTYPEPLTTLSGWSGKSSAHWERNSSAQCLQEPLPRELPLDYVIGPEPDEDLR